MKIAFKYICAVAVLAAAVVLTACEKTHYGKDKGETPRIEYVRSTDPGAADSLIVEAAMGSVIALIGDGFSGVSEAWFNDQPAKLNPTLITDHSVIVTVPGGMPEEVTNTITLRTKKGKECVYDFKVMIPIPKVESISCEWALDGQKVTLSGNYFFADENGAIEVLFPGNLKAAIERFDTREIVCNVPAGALPGTITVTSLYGTGRSVFTFRDRTGLFLDGENGPWNGWNMSDFGTEGGIDGSYLKFEGTLGAWAWPNNTLHLYYINPTGQPLADISSDELQYYALRFEANCFEWHDTPMVMWFTKNHGSHSVDETEAQYHWKPYLVDGEKVNYVTDGWVTVTIPLTDFNTDKEESTTDRSIGDSSNMIDFHMMPFGAADINGPIKLWMDNLRIVKIN